MIASGNTSSPGDAEGAPRGGANVRRSARPMIAITALIVGTVLLSLFTWRGNWFGRPLSVEQIRGYLTDTEHPRKAQHALEQFTRQVDAGNPEVRELYPLVAGLATHERPEVRGMAAWAMGWDNQHEPFHEALAGLVLDPVPFVHRNAALALAKFNDPAGRPVLRTMLSPYTVRSPVAGTISKLLARGTPVQAHMTVAEIAADGEEPRPIAAPVGGRVARLFVENGAAVAGGDTLYEFDPAEPDTYEAIRALYLVGRAEDIELVREAMNAASASQRIAEQAPLTIKAIEARAADGGPAATSPEATTRG